jgi:hypothetical protein
LLLTLHSLPSLALFIFLSKVRRRLLQTESCILVKQDITCEGPCDDEQPLWWCELQGDDAAASQCTFVIFDGLEDNELDSDTNVASGITTLHIDGAEIVNGSLKVPKNAKKEYGKKEKRKTGKKGDRKRGKDKEGSRVLVSETRQVLAVRVIANDRSTTSSLSTMSDKIFGTNADTINLVERYNSCSYGQLVMEPYQGTTDKGFNIVDGVVEVVIDMDVDGVDNGIVREAAQAAATDILGDLSSQFDHVMFCLPPGTQGNWLAYGELYCREASKAKTPEAHTLFFTPPQRSSIRGIPPTMTFGATIRVHKCMRSVR